MINQEKRTEGGYLENWRSNIGRIKRERLKVAALWD